MATSRQGTTLFTALLLLVGIAVVVQLWLVTAAMEALLAHDYQLLLPFAIGSLVLFLLNLLFLRMVFSFDRQVK